MNHEHTQIKTPEYVSLQFQLAGLGSRAAAFIIDQAILMAFNLLVILILVLVTVGVPSSSFMEEMESMVMGISIIVIFLLNWGYFFAFEFFAGGKTIGKRLLGIRVIQENGHSITLLSSFIRNLMRIIDSLPVGYFLGLLMVFFHSKHKRLGDVVAGTIVVHERKAKQQKKLSPLEKEIQNRGLSKDVLTIDEWTLASFGTKEWQLISTYANRFTQLSQKERTVLTKQIADIVLPKLGIEAEGKPDSELENTMLLLYLNLREEWEFEL